MVAFGVSIGDAIALTILAKDILTSLKESTGSSEQYLSVIAGLRSLELAFPQIQRCHDKLPEESQKVELRQVVAECKKAIKDFLQSIAKYHGHLSTTGTKNGFKDGLRKVQWRFCKADDLDSFRLRLIEHRQSIQILLVNYQTSSPALEEQTASMQKALMQYGNTLGIATQSIVRARSSLNSLGGAISQVVQSCQQTAESLVVIKQLLKALNKQVEQFYRMQNEIPPQVLFSQPVTLITAFDTPFPFHVETVNSKEMFLAMMTVLYKDAGLEKLRSGEFAIEDTVVGHDVDLDRPWNLCFRAGDRKAMSFIFAEETDDQQTICPFCKHISPGSSLQQVNCSNCSRWFQRVEDVTFGNKPNTTRVISIAQQSTTDCHCQSDDEEVIFSANQSRRDRIEDFSRVRLQRRIQFDLLCPFQILDCGAAFADIVDFKTHVFSHFKDHSAPSRAVCFLCDEAFSQMETHHPARAWNNMLSHLANDHYRQGQRIATLRTDFSLMRWMYSRRIVSDADFKHTRLHPAPVLLPASSAFKSLPLPPAEPPSHPRVMWPRGLETTFGAEQNEPYVMPLGRRAERRRRAATKIHHHLKGL